MTKIGLREGLKTSPLDAFNGNIEPTKVSALYRLGVLLVALAMVLLPLTYVGLIGMAGYGVYWHATANSGILESRGGSVVAKLIIYAGPLILGIILVIFMVKPFFGRMPKKFAPLSVTRKEEPTLYGYIDRICEQVKAPKPKRVDIDTQVNASASFRRGIWSLFGNDLVLTIGMPLTAGLTMRELSGVLAHELGHFAQGAGMRVSYLVRAINAWFARVVYERDQFDQSLRRASGTTGLNFAGILPAARGCVWLTRRFLWLLMLLGNTISSFLLRQMEYDADSYEAKLSGSRQFAETLRKIQLLSVGANVAIADLIESWQSQRLPDDISAYVNAKTRSLPNEIVQDVDKSIAEGNTGAFDMHPTDRDRIHAAEKLGCAGIFKLEAPASELLQDFDALSKRATLHYYREVQELDVDASNLVAAESLIAEARDRDDAQKAIADHFGELNVFLNPVTLTLSEIAPLESIDAMRENLASARQVLAECRTAIQTSNTEHEFAVAELGTIRKARHLINAGFRLPAEQFFLRESTLVAADEAEHKAATKLTDAAGNQKRFQESAKARLQAALQLANSPAIENGELDALRPEISELTEVLSIFRDSFEELLQLKGKVDALELLFGEAMQGADTEGFRKEVERLAIDAQHLVEEIVLHLKQVNYPFEHAGGELSLAEYVKPNNSQGNKAQMAHNAGTVMLGKMISLYYRTLGRLVVIAKDVEDRMIPEKKINPTPHDRRLAPVAQIPSPVTEGG